MKSTKIVAVVCIVMAITISAFTFRQTNSIKGTVAPADKAVKAVAILSTDRTDKDSISAPITNGSFEIQNLKSGDYTVVIDAEAPYGNATKVGVTVNSGKTTDVGEIQLLQK